MPVSQQLSQCLAAVAQAPRYIARALPGFQL